MRMSSISGASCWRLSRTQSSDCRQCLPPEESVRAHRIKSDQQGGHFMVAHGVLRLVLSLYRDREPRELSFQNVPSGKPI